MEKAITFCLVVVGLINVAPLLGVLSAQKLESAYAISLADTNLIILMQHRALLFGILGGFILYAAFTPVYQGAAMLMAGVSMIGFAMLIFGAESYNQALGKVLYLDILGIVFLLVAVLSRYVVRTG